MQVRRVTPISMIEPMSIRRMSVRGAILALALMPALASGPVLAADDADWPCIQRLVPEIAAGVVWAGPLLDAITTHWATDTDVAPLAAKLAARTTPPAVIEQEAKALAARLDGKVRAEKLSLLFIGTLEIINGDRARVIADIGRYARGQRQLAERVATESKELQTLTGTPADPAAVADLEARRNWDLRVFDDRHKVLSQVCEQPVLLEQHAFTLGRIIAATLETSP